MGLLIGAARNVFTGAGPTHVTLKQAAAVPYASLGVRVDDGPEVLIVLVTDAMATIGTDMTSFTLNGRTIYRKDGSLRLADGTLAGADLDMISAVRYVHRVIGLDLSEALRMASLYPAQAIGQSHRLGRFANGTAADIVALSDDLDIGQVWIGGKMVFEASASP